MATPSIWGLSFSFQSHHMPQSTSSAFFSSDRLQSAAHTQQHQYKEFTKPMSLLYRSIALLVYEGEKNRIKIRIFPITGGTKGRTKGEWLNMSPSAHGASSSAAPMLFWGEASKIIPFFE